MSAAPSPEPTSTTPPQAILEPAGPTGAPPLGDGARDQAASGRELPAAGTAGSSTEAAADRTSAASPAHNEGSFEPPEGRAARPAAAGPPLPRIAPGFLLDVRLTVAVEAGRVQMPIREVMELGPGSVIEFPQSASDPVQIYANGQCIGRGEIVVVGDQFGVRVTELGSVTAC